MREGLLLGRMVLPVLAVGRAHGLDEGEVARIGIVSERLAALDTMVSSAQVYRLLEVIAPRVDLERFAIEVAAATTAADIGPLGMALRTAPTARAALALLIRDQRAVNTVAGFHMLEEGGELTLAESRCGPEGLGRLIAAEITVMTSIQLGRKLFGDDFAPLHIAIERKGSFGRYAAFAGCPVRGGAAGASLTFSASLLDAPRVAGDAELFQFFSDLLAPRARDADDASAVASLRHELGAVLADGEPTIGEMARRLGQSPRSLQRRLAAEGQRFSRVVDELRHELAVTYLARARLAIAEIAFALGFNEVASFHRAFRRWEGTTPAAYRARSPTR